MKTSQFTTVAAVFTWGTRAALVILFLLVAGACHPLAQEVVPTQTPDPELSIGSQRLSEIDEMTLVYVPAGDFEMGSASSNQRTERPHQVYVDAFWIDRTEVTNAMYALCVQAGACTPPKASSSASRPSYYGNPQYVEYPVVRVDWHQAAAYCAWAGRRLPTEAEWEKAARGTDGREFPWGQTTPSASLLNYNGNVGDTTPVGSYPQGASPYGALDMAGNVTEWVADCYDHNYYRHSPRQNPQGPTFCPHNHRAFRGGCSWEPFPHAYIGVANRFNDLDSSTYPTRGFRCALTTAPDKSTPAGPSVPPLAVPETNLPLSGAYFGQPRPGLTPVPFAPEVFGHGGSYDLHLHSSLYFSEDGRQVFFSNQTPDLLEISILYMQQEDGLWSEPLAFPSPEVHTDLPLLNAPDGRHRLYVYTDRPLGGGASGTGHRLWFIDRTASGWSSPYALDELDHDQGPIYFSAILEGQTESGDIFVSRFVNGRYSEPRRLAEPVNSEFDEHPLCIAPDESFLILYRFSRSNRSVSGCYLTFHRPDGTWTPPIDLDQLYGLELGFDASLSPDGQYLFLLDRGAGIVWVDVEAIRKLGPEGY